jgi:hypothetical protein
MKLADKYSIRPSPPYHANDFPNKIKIGNDKNEYISKKDKNGIYKWVKIGLKKSAEEYYKQFPDYKKSIYDSSFFTKKNKDLTKSLKKIGVSFYFVKWNKCSPYGSSTDYECWSENRNKSFPIFYDSWSENNDPSGNYIVYFESRFYWDTRHKDGIMHMDHFIHKKLWNQTNEILQEYFPNRTNGITSKADALHISIYPKKIKKDKEKKIFSLDFVFSTIINEDSKKYIKKLKKLIPKEIGYISEYDKNISNGKILINFNINYDKVSEFKKLVKNIKNNVNIKKISYK